MGGIVGAPFSSTILSSYYLDSCGAGGDGMSLTAMQFNDQGTFSDWDFDTVWQMNSTLGRPVLHSNVE